MIVSPSLSFEKYQVGRFAVMFKDLILYFLNLCFVVGKGEGSLLVADAY